MTDSTAAPAFSITLNGVEYPLVPSTPALRRIERTTGTTLFALATEGSDGALSIDHLTCLAICMAAAPDGDPLFGMAQMQLKGTIGAGRGVGIAGNVVADAIVAAGIAYSLSRLIIPIIAVFAGTTTPDGGLKPKEG